MDKENILKKYSSKGSRLIYKNGSKYYKSPLFYRGTYINDSLIEKLVYEMFFNFNYILKYEIEWLYIDNEYRPFAVSEDIETILNKKVITLNSSGLKNEQFFEKNILFCIEQIILDYIVCNPDRHGDNILICDKDKSTLIFDNGTSFWSDIFNKDYIDFKKLDNSYFTLYGLNKHKDLFKYIFNKFEDLIITKLDKIRYPLFKDNFEFKDIIERILEFRYKELKEEFGIVIF